jgi:hypothetical protein
MYVYIRENVRLYKRKCTFKPIPFYFLYLKVLKVLKAHARGFFDAHKFDFLTIYGGLCALISALIFPPQSPQWGDETSLIFTDYRQTKIFRVDRGRIPWFVLANVIAPRLVAFLATGLRLIAPLGKVV